MTLTVLIAEDEAPQRVALRAALLAQWPEITHILECADGEAAVQMLSEHAPQVAFLDIRMPGISGLEVAQAASGQAHVVFVTAYDEYAVHAFEAGAVDYLLKPVTEARLATCITRLQQRMLQAAPADLGEVLHKLRQQLQQQNTTQPIRWITASMGEVVKVLSVDDVLCFLADNKYTRVVTRAGEALIRTSLKDLLPGLDVDAFWQVHRSSVVRVSAIQKVKRNELGRMELQLDGMAELLSVSQPFQYRFRSM